MERYAVVEAPAAMKGKVTYIDNFVVISSDIMVTDSRLEIRNFERVCETYYV